MGHWTVFHPSVFFLTFITYALYHIVRKTCSYVQSSLIAEWTPAPQYQTPGDASAAHSSLFPDQQSAEAFVGILNAIFLFVYAASTFINGMIAERVDRRLFLTVGMTLSAVVMFVFGPVLEWTGGCSRGAYIVLEVLSALFQSTGWPCLVPIMANWFSRESRGYMLGLWASSSSMGSILGAVIVAEVVGYGYEYAFVLTCSMLIAGAALCFFGLVTSPGEVGLTLSFDQDQHSRNVANDDENNLNDETDDTCLLKKERQWLLEERTQCHGELVARASYGSAENDCTVRACTTECSLRDGPLRGIPLTVGPDNTTQLSDQSAPGLHSLQRHSPTILADYHSCVDNVDNDFNEDLFSSVRLHWVPDSPKESHHSSPMTEHVRNNHRTNAHTNERFRNSISTDSIAITASNNNRSYEAERGRPMKQHSEGEHAIGFLGALLLPGVISYALCSCCLKMVIYIFYFWLPFYLSSSYGWTESTADRLSLWYDVGGIFGACAATFLMSRLSKSALVLTPMLLASLPLLYVYGVLHVGSDLTTNAVLLFCLGGLLNGVSNPLSAAVSADLGQQEALRGNAKSMSTVVGILEGSATVGAAVGQISVPYLTAALGWDSLFYLLMVATSLSGVSVGRVLRSEVRELVTRRGVR